MKFSRKVKEHLIAELEKQIDEFYISIEMLNKQIKELKGN